MAFKLPNFLTTTNAKARVSLLIGAVILIVILIYFAFRFLGGNQEAVGPSRIATPPSSLQSTPGSQIQGQYYQAVMQLNNQTAQQAQISGGSAVPTLVNAEQSGFGQNCTVLCPGDENVDVANDINNLVRLGKLSQDDANKLIDLAKSNVSPEEYAAALDELVKSGKLTPEQARLLLSQYKKQHANALANESAKMMDGLIKSGKLPIDVANQLLALQRSNVSPADYAAELDRLVKEGKITPQMAAQLLAQYKQQQAREGAKKGLFGLQQLVKSGAITADVAKALGDLQNKNVPVDQYAAELQRLVAAGKMTPEVAAKLLEQYRKQRVPLATNNALDAVVAKAEDAASADIDNLVKSGKLSPDAANLLHDLQKKDVSPEEYKAALDKLVAAGKLSPQDAAALLASYQKLKGVRAEADKLRGLQGNYAAVVEKAVARAADDINNLVKTGKISPDTANALLALQNRDVSPEEYKATLDKLVAAGKISPQDAAALLASYQKLKGVRAEAARLQQQGNKAASVADYANELKKAVQAGLITPEAAEALLQEYQAAMAAPGAGVVPTTETALPGAEDFARLQQRVQEQTTETAAVTTTTTTAQTDQFAAAAAQAEAQAAEERQQRIQALQSAMSAQAQLLTAAWQAPRMVHQGGASETGKNAAGGPPPFASANKKKGSNGLAIEKGPALIKAGTILFGVLDTAVDSDYPDTPVMVTIVQGPFKGAKLLGKLALAKGQDRVSLNFTLMDQDAWPHTKTISAFAIDPDTARTVLASNVDYHYLKRYGALFASSFLSGYASGITTSGSTDTTGIFGTSTTHPALSPGEKIAVGLGEVGTKFSDAVAEYVNTPTTVKVNAGVGLGILFMDEVAADTEITETTTTTTTTATS